MENEKKWIKFYEKLNHLLEELDTVTDDGGSPIVKNGEEVEIRVHRARKVSNPVPEQITPKVIDIQLD